MTRFISKKRKPIHLLHLSEKNAGQKFLKAFVITIMILLATKLTEVIPYKIKLPDVVNKSAELDIYDLSYSGGEMGLATRDSQIVLIEVADNRREIADEIKTIKSMGAAVIGLDVMFDSPKEPVTDSYLSSAIKNTGCIVATKLIKDSLGQITDQASFFNDSSYFDRQGYINFYFLGSDKWPVIRCFMPFCNVGAEKRYSFAARIAEKYSPEKFRALAASEDSIQAINYTGVLPHFYNFSSSQIKDPALYEQIADKVKGKIVLVGFFKNIQPPPILDDAHYTPLNDKMTGKSPPDMYGVAIHANIISMALNGKYITEIRELYTYIFAGALILLLLLLEMKFAEKTKLPYLKPVLNAVLLFLLIWLFLLLFEYYRIKTPLFPIVFSLVLKEIYQDIINFFEYMLNCIYKAGNYVNRLFKKNHL